MDEELRERPNKYHEIDYLTAFLTNRGSNESYEEWRNRLVKDLPVILKPLGYRKVIGEPPVLSEDLICDFTDIVLKHFPKLTAEKQDKILQGIKATAQAQRDADVKWFNGS